MINLTNSAIKKIEKSINVSQLLRIAVQAGGCNGYSYVLNFIERDKVTENDMVMIFSSFQVVIDAKSLDLLVGTTVDYEEGAFSSGFKFNNPGATRCCGCGESFSC
jgi:iron-sulfur cluster assembly accessory protein